MIHSFSKKIFLVIAVLASLVLLAPALAQDDVLIEPVACEEPGELTMWVWDELWAEVIGASIDNWIETYCPGASVDLIRTPWGQYWDALQTNAAAGDLPDIFNMSQNRFYFYASNDALLNLQPYWEEFGVDTTVWGTGLVDPYRWGETGDLYAGPVNWDTIAVFYNKDMFEAAGVPLPTANWTWDDFAAAAAALTDAEADIYGAAAYAEFQAGFASWIASTDTSPVVDPERTRCTLQEPGSLEALNFLKTLYDNGYMPSVSIMGGASADDAFNYWIAGRTAMVTAGSWKLPDAFAQADFEWDIARIPVNPETGISRPMLHSVGYTAAANTENPALAANLILYLVSDEGQQYFAEAGGVAPANPNLQEEWIAAFGETDVNIDAFVNSLPDTQGVTLFSEIWDTANTELVVNIFDLGVSVEDATAQACEFIVTQLPE